jgi:phosphoglucosamine mutase
MLACMRQARKPLSELSKVMTLAPQKTINVEVKSKPPLEELPELHREIEAAVAELAGEGRVLIRYSGTQPMCRVMVEGPTEEITEGLARRLADTVEKLLG